MFEGKVEIFKKINGEWHLVKKTKNLFVDDGKELTLDLLFGRMSWWNPQTTESYIPDGAETAEWNTRRYLGLGECMFNNSSQNTRNGIYEIQSGANFDYPIEDTWLVNPEDSFLSKELSGNRAVLDITRRDQQVEMACTITPGVEAPQYSYIREVGVFLSGNGPAEDPSLVDAYKEAAMICRAALWDSGYFDISGNEYDEEISGAVLCYKNDPHYFDSETKFRWTFGEL